MRRGSVSWLRPNAGLLAVLTANGAPAVGLLAFGTSGVGLVVFYWLEFTALSVWALVRALFAGQPPETGGEGLGATWGDAGIPIPGTDLTILYRTLQGLVLFVPLLAVVWVGVGGLVAGPVIAATPDAEMPPWVVVGAAAVFFTEGGRTVVEYFHRGGYRETTVGAALKGVFLRGVVLAGVGLLVVMIADEFAEGRAVSVEAAASGPLVFAAVGVKFGIDLAAHYATERDASLGGLI